MMFPAVLLIAGVIIGNSGYVEMKYVGRGRREIMEKDEDPGQLAVWRVVSVSEYEHGSPVKQNVHDHNAKLPTCTQNRTKSNFISEVCMTLRSDDDQDTTKVGFQYCDCPDSISACSRHFDPDDPYTYAIIDNMQLKTCIRKIDIPLCTEVNKRHRGGVVAKLWYGEELPQRVLIHCRCPRRHVWGRVQCTSSGRICFVMACEKI